MSAPMVAWLALAASNLLAWDPSAAAGGWVRWSPRPALAPASSVEREELRVSGQGNAYVLGGWRRAVSGIAPGTTYRFSAEVEARGIESLRQQVVCQLLWTGATLGNEITPEYVNEARETGKGLFRVEQTFTALEGATGAEISLLVQWAPGAALSFRRVALEAVPPAPPRPVRVATVYWRPSRASTPEANVSAFAGLVDRAAAERPDLILLPEAITSIGTGLDVAGAAQDAAGPAFQALSAKARQHHAYVVYGAYEKRDGVVFNSVFVVGRDGALAGVHRKVQLPVGEVESGLSPGAGFATLDLDFGRVGILICHDAAFGEPARVLALEGAELLLVPGWGGDLTQLRARALDNGIWLVTSGYDVPSGFIDPTGEVLASTWKDPDGGVASMSIDLAKRVRRPWLGDWRNAVMKQRRTDAYQGLLEGEVQATAAEPASSRRDRLVEANIVGVHAFQVLLARKAGKGDPACYSPGALSEAALQGLEAHQVALLASDPVAVREWAEGRPSAFDPGKDLEPLLKASLPLPDALPVNVFTAYLQRRAAAPRSQVRPIASLLQTNLEVERDGDRLQELFAFYIHLGLPVYVGQLDLPGSDADFLAMGKELEGQSCVSPVGTSAAEWQIAGRKNWNWGEKNLHIRDEKVVARELLEEPAVKALVPAMRALPPRRIAVVGHSFTMGLHWSSPSSFVPIVTAMFAMENPRVEFKQFSGGGLTSSRAQRNFYDAVLAWKPDTVLLVVLNRTPEDIQAFSALGKGFAAAGARVLTFDDVHDPDASDPALVGRDIQAARAAGMTVIEVGTRLASAPDRSRFICLDGIHMTEPYHRLMAKEWLAFLVGVRGAALEP